MTLIPVSSIFNSVLCSSRLGAGRWMGGFGGSDGSHLVHGLSDDVQNAPQRFAPYRNHNRPARIQGLHSPDHSLGRLHAHATHAVFAEMLLHFGYDANVPDRRVSFDNDTVVDGGEMLLLEFAIHDGTDDLNDLPD